MIAGRYHHPDLRQRLASEYVIGTLHGRARQRFEALMKYDPGLRHSVKRWEDRLAPLAHGIRDIAPPMRVWQRISERIGIGRRVQIRPEVRAYGWRLLAAFSTSAALMLTLYLGTRPAVEPPAATVAVLQNREGAAVMAVSWPPLKQVKEPAVRIRPVAAAVAPSGGKSWELWVLPDGEGRGKPRSLGRIAPGKDQRIQLSALQIPLVGKAWGFAVSEEAAEGSVSGVPSTPFLFQGQCVKLP